MTGFQVRIDEYGSAEVKKRLLNTICRDGLTMTGEFWEKDYLPRHFEKGAEQRYNYKLVSRVYAIIKNRAQRVRPWIGRTRGPWVPAPKPARPWVWSGATMNDLLSGGLRVVATATTNNQKVVVKLPVPHPINPDHKDELGRLTPEEFEVMTRLCFGYVVGELDKIRDIRSATFEIPIEE